MLASMDEILEPTQQEEIKQKIEESEFATSIMHRVRDVTRRIRLGAPKLTGKGMGLDPNTVAMYLDNTLSSERVPDFEKVCLESDVHLAEVAACHQVLALVLGEPAEVDARLRQKLYDIGESAAAAGAEALKPPPPLPAVAQQPRRRERPHVPEYLREERRSRWWAVAATIVLALLLGAAVVRAIGPYDRTNRALAWLPIWGEEDAQVATNDRQGDDARPTDEANGAVDEQSAGVPATNNGEKSTQNGGAIDTDAAASAKAAALKNPLAQNGKAIPLDGPQVPADSGAQAPIPPEPAGDSGAANANAATPSVDLGPNVTVDTQVPPRDAVAPVDKLPTEDDPGARNGPAPLGRFMQDRNVLLRLNRRGEWQRVVQGATLNAGERLLVLPTYRPSISLTGGLTMQVLGETLVELLAADAGGMPTLRIPYGRAVLMTAGKPEVSIHLVLGGQEGTATFLGAESTLAVEVRQFLPAGANPETELAYVAIDLYADGGDVEWKQSENPVARRITAPGRLGLGTPYPYAAENEEEKLPEWITAEKVIGVHDIASDDLNQELTEENEKPIALVLREFAEHRKWERKHLGARSLALIGEFDAFLPGFNDADQRSVWTQQIESLQAALARGPETAAKVRETFQQQRGREDGWKLYRMLGGYSKADIQAGAAEQLVRYLGHNSQEFRVLAIHALRSIPGVPQNYSSYLPFGALAERQIQVRKWRGYLEGDKSPLSPEGALDRPGPTPKQPWPWREPTEEDDASEESAAIPRSVPILR
jgi:hypothetical protein